MWVDKRSCRQADERERFMYRIAICDDDNHFLTMVCDQVREYCDSHGVSAVVKKYDDAVTMIEDIEAEKLFDAYILDIEMGKHSGLEIARMIEARSSIACIIFLTAYDSYAIEACEIRVFRYFLKEKMRQEFPKLLDALFHHLELQENNETYTIRNQRKYIKFPIRDIIYIYKNGKNVYFVMIGGIEEHERITLQEAYNRLNSREMFFLDRGIIVNVFHIQRIVTKRRNAKTNEITTNKIVMRERHEITTNKMSIEALKQYLNRYWGDILE